MHLKLEVGDIGFALKKFWKTSSGSKIKLFGAAFKQTKAEISLRHLSPSLVIERGAVKSKLLVRIVFL